ncbi:recombinase family protein [Paenarthrobacter sp. NPDC089989]|uniref:recombinase family protein n=1 Tax=unclassified Paenarthrobacter TaxID=2634190 RepID=UPI00381C7D50
MSNSRARLRSIPQTQLRAVAYIRVSKEREGMISPELQMAAIEQHCERSGYTIVETITDLDLSGQLWKRRQVEKAIAMIEAGKADILVVWKVSRVSRNRKDWAIAVDRVEGVGGRLESATEPLDASTSSGRFARGMLAELAAFESERLGEQWKETHNRRTKLGLPHNGGDRTGYTYEDGSRYVIDPATGPVVAEAYRMYIAGHGYDRIRLYLFEHGIESKRPPGRPMSTTGVRLWMESGFPAGMIHTPAASQRYQPGAHEAIITSQEWAAFLTAREQRRKGPRRYQGDKIAHPLSGLVLCAACGRSTHVNKDHSTKGRPVRFRCRTGDKLGEPCSARGIALASTIEQAVEAWLADFEHHIDTHAAQFPSPSVRRADGDLTKRRLAEAVAAIERLTDGFARGIISERVYLPALTKLEAEAAGYEDALRQLTAAGSTEDLVDLAADIKRDMWLLPVAESNAILRQLLRVRLTKGQPVEVIGVWQLGT